MKDMQMSFQLIILAFFIAYFIVHSLTVASYRALSVLYIYAISLSKEE